MQNNLTLSNFWEDAFNVLQNLTTLATEETKNIAFNHIGKFNNNQEYFGDFDSLLSDIIYLYSRDQEFRNLFSYSEEEASVLVGVLNSNKDAVQELTDKKLADKVNVSGQKWREQKFEDKPEELPKIKTTTATTKNNFLSETDLADYGKKIGGAKKDLYSRLESITEDDIASKPLSKTFPEPDYAKMFADGLLSQEGAIYLSYLYKNIPTKPRKSFYVKRWVITVQNAIDTMKEMLSGTLKNVDVVTEVIKKTPHSHLGGDLGMYSNIMKGLNFPTVNVKLGKYNIKHFMKFSTKNYETGEMETKPERYVIVSGSYMIKSFETFDEAVLGLSVILDITKEKKATSKKETKFNVYQSRQTKEFFIGKKGALDIIHIMDGFSTQKEVFDYLKNNQDKLEEIWSTISSKNKAKERPEINADREGIDWRENGENISSEKLAQKFGFKGIEYGNWANLKERQDHVNNCYDALMDISNALGIESNDLTLGGSLSIAFGSRGSGGLNSASAHYEPDKVVINLTKKNGAGSLFHEYWHALDNYLSKLRGESYGFISSKPKPLYTREVNENKTGYKLDDRVNHDLLDAFKNIMDTINSSGVKERSRNLDSSRSKVYWSEPHEMSARCAENYIINKLGISGTKNDYLANFKEMGAWVNDGGLDMDTYPYPTKDEEKVINEAFDQFFDELKKSNHLKQK